jgi:hypothetical protein
MRQFMMTVTALAMFGAMVVTAQAETPSFGQVSHQSSGYSEWATAADYQKLFNAMVQQHRYPRVVEAKVFNGVVLYHAAFEPYPAGRFTFWSHHGITPDIFAQKNDQYRRDGYRLVHKQSVHLGGREFVQATWVSTGPNYAAQFSGFPINGNLCGSLACKCAAKCTGELWNTAKLWDRSSFIQSKPLREACIDKCVAAKNAAQH